MADKLYGVVIEWNAAGNSGRPTQRPPTRWYRRLYNLTGMSVRKGAKDKTGLVGRLNPGSYGIIIQEGCIICGSYSLARTIAHMAEEGVVEGDKLVKPDAVHLVEMESLSMAMTDADRQALQLMETTFGKVGRRPGEPLIWSVACMEEMATYQVEAYHAINCPHCGGMHVRARVGEMLYLADPGGPVAAAWRLLRFATGQWEPSRRGGDLPPAQVTLRDKAESDLVTAILASPLAAELNSMDREKAFEILDAILIARLYWSGERRLKARIEAAAEFFRLGGQPTDVFLGEMPGQFDLLDCAGPLGVQFAASLLFRKVTGDRSAVAARQVDAPLLNGNLMAHTVPA